jgi:hypothetical protein
VDAQPVSKARKSPGRKRTAENVAYGVTALRHVLMQDRKLALLERRVTDLQACVIQILAAIEPQGEA